MRTRRRDYDSPLDFVEESEGEVEDSSVLPTVLDDLPSVQDPPRLRISLVLGESTLLTTWTTVEVILWQYGIVIRIGPRASHLSIERHASNPGKGHRGSAI